MDAFAKSTLRVPVKLVDGRWEFFYGGAVPAREGTVGELVIDRQAIADRKFLELLNRKTEHKILDAGTALRVALTVRPDIALDEALKKHLLTSTSMNFSGEYLKTLRSNDTQFVEVTIGEPSPQQREKRPDDIGGIWLTVQGNQPKGIATSRVEVPDEVSDTPLDSVNHAFTRLSEKYEPWRKSHTGNIYDRVLYQEKNGRWYPLNVLRNAALARDEHELIRARWEEIAETLRMPLASNQMQLPGLADEGGE
ncbi:hypothetical protein [Caballeronia sp. GAFFF1]|uniref:hypothetical protein n=1 Tax=Caballeronia sp. GAFFF1 TaxID=2921779 RepID=UPI0020295F93|nr:hypothetical protein [Caballeronia sp. GAFFF1]